MGCHLAFHVHLAFEALYKGMILQCHCALPNPVKRQVCGFSGGDTAIRHPKCFLYLVRNVLIHINFTVQAGGWRPSARSRHLYRTQHLPMTLVIQALACRYGLLIIVCGIITALLIAEAQLTSAVGFDCHDSTSQQRDLDSCRH